MRRFLLVVGVILVGSFSAAQANAQDRLTVFGGYSYVHQNVTIIESPTSCPEGLILTCSPFTVNTGINFNGFNVSGTYHISGPFGVTGQFTGNFGPADHGSAHLYTYLFGPEIRCHHEFSPFAHILLGGAHESIGGTSNGFIVPTETANGFAMMAGGGLDIKIGKHIAFRPIAVDYLLFHSNGSNSNMPQVTSGFTLRY